MNSAATAINLETTLREVMTTKILPLKVDDTLSLVDDLVNRFRIRHFPVFDNDQLCGVVCQADLLCASLASVYHHRVDEPREVLRKIPVKDVTKPAAIVSPDTSVYAGARMMVEDGMECLIIMAKSFSAS